MQSTNLTHAPRSRGPVSGSGERLISTLFLWELTTSVRAGRRCLVCRAVRAHAMVAASLPEMDGRIRNASIERLQSALTSVALVAKLLVSFVVAAYEGWLRKQQAVVSTVRDRSFLPSSLVIFISALSGYFSYPTSRFDPILQAFRLPSLPAVKWFPRRGRRDSSEPKPESSVHVEVLYDPSPAPIRADVVFIHGLHGSIVHTWKQGLWQYRKQVKNETLFHTVPPPYYRSSSDNNDDATPPPPTEENAIIINNTDNTHDTVLENITDIINSIDDTRRDSCSAATGEEPYSPCWPKDWLPQDCPGVRIIALNYTTDPFLWRPVWITKRIRSCLKERSHEMVENLISLGVGQNPIVWVGHSKGGLFVKQMLVDARDTEDQRLRCFLEETKGIMFYSVPHRGSSLAHLNLPLLRQSIELLEVKKDCQEVLALHKEFMKLYQENLLTADIFSFVETIMTFMFVTNVRVVSVDSADLGFGTFQGVNIDHREICKPLNRNCFLYKELANLINRVV